LRSNITGQFTSTVGKKKSVQRIWNLVLELVELLLHDGSFMFLLGRSGDYVCTNLPLISDVCV